MLFLPPDTSCWIPTPDQTNLSDRFVHRENLAHFNPIQELSIKSVSPVQLFFYGLWQVYLSRNDIARNAAMTPPYRILANLTLQSHRQLRRIESRLVQHPGTSVSLRSRTSSVNSNGALEEVTSTDAELIPSLANWDVYDNDLDPMAWSVRHKLFATGIVTYISWLVQFASSVDAGVTEGIEAEFGVGRITSSLATGEW